MHPLLGMLFIQMYRKCHMSKWDPWYPYMQSIPLLCWVFILVGWGGSFNFCKGQTKLKYNYVTEIAKLICLHSLWYPSSMQTCKLKFSPGTTHINIRQCIMEKFFPVKSNYFIVTPHWSVTAPKVCCHNCPNCGPHL